MSLDTFDTVLGFAAVMLMLSLFVTAVVQLVSALLRLRHGSLVWGLGQLFSQLGLDEVLARQLARQVTTQSPALASRASIGLAAGAEAISRDELIHALNDLAAGRHVQGLAPQVLQWVQALVAPNAAPAPDLSAVQAELTKLFPAQAQAASEAVNRALVTSTALSTQVGLWFDAAMSRTADRFALFTRYVTVALSGAVVLCLGVDAVHIYTTLRSDNNLRSTWVAAAGPLVTQADKLLGQTSCSQLPLQALRRLIDNPATPADTDAAIQKQIDLNPPLPDMAAAQALLDRAGASAHAQALAEAEVASAQKCVNNALAEVKTQLKAMQTTQPLLLGSPLPPPQAASGPAATAAATRNDHRLFGGLLAWVLLSLGAPFWFNLLKTLSSLRPLVATRAETPPAANPAR
ncbi:hypothetical protein [Aquabacterium sp. OR-4]|uniref:hypothetical protein n=1 Tax=Aquabacterium sp. OR-4 TaxID=2978127 RepID=UPI0028C599C2|nr:hypothetical protein [Aquabacterium sp. OR-4]MDT7836014.1 hypothetical protein [Aquabacterium sp. OR-4]